MNLTNTMKSFWLLFMIGGVLPLFSQNVEVDINPNIRHSVGGVSDFGRDRHITLHSSISETDWVGELDKMDYLLNDLDVYLGRDNGSATWKFMYSAEDPDNPNHHDPDSLTAFAEWWKSEYERIITDNGTKPYESRALGSIQGTNPHPTYPTLSYWYMCGSEWGRQNGYDWLPQDIETSAAWISQYLDEFFVNNLQEEGEVLPEYWEVINEPDMKMNTGAFMITSWEDIWEYHNLVAQGVRARLGNNAPKIGGMTWGLHDLFADDLHRSRTVGYSDAYYGSGPENDAAKAYARQQTESAYLNQTGPWTQWDVLWKGFMDNAGPNMDFYSVHIYDWPTYNASGGATRAGGHTEALLDMVEWYDVSQNGIANRKPILLSEYGAVQGQWDYTAHDARYDWEVLKPFSSMMMQFLERPDYIIKSMPFTPVKAQWGDTDTNGDGTPEYRYQYTMMRDDDGDGNWEWSDYIKWFELWAEVDGTRVDTKASDPDIQVDAYVDGNDLFLILNNLETASRTLDLNFFGNTPNLQSVNIKHLYLSGVRDVRLDNTSQGSAPASVTLAPEATMILKYTYGSNVAINQTSVESKFYGASVGPNQRTDIQAGDNLFYVNGVNVPQDASKAEAMLRITANLFDAEDGQVGFLSIDKLTVNGVEIETPLDWRGGSQNRSRWFGTLEIPVPVNLLQTNNTFAVDFHHSGEVCVVNLVTWDFSTAPGRSIANPNPPNPIAVTGVSVSPTNISLQTGQSQDLTETITPANASNKAVSWSSSNSNIASVDGNGLVTAIAAGAVTITVTTADGGHTAQCAVSVAQGTVPVNGVSVSPTSLALNVGQTQDLTETVNPSNATNKSVNWSTSNATIATVNSNGLVSAVGNGSATITVTTVDGGFTANTSVTVSTTPPPPPGDDILIEAEQFVATGGTWNDAPYGGPGLGVNAAGIKINYVNTGDWASYNFTVTDEGEYQVTYHISSPSNNAQITLNIDNEQISVDAVPNNGQWDSYQPLTALGTAMLANGSHTAVLTASGSNAWQWNLDRITLTRIGDLPGNPPPANATLVIEAEDFSGTGGTFNDAPYGGPGFAVNDAGSNINYVNSGDWVDYQVNVTVAGTYAIDYAISTPSNNAQVQFLVDGVVSTTTNVPNNGQWDSYTSLSGGTASLSVGNHTIRLVASGSNAWQWNLDKITLTTGNGARQITGAGDEMDLISTFEVFPNPAMDVLKIKGLVDGEYAFEIFNLTGQAVYSGVKRMSGELTLDVSQLKEGIYLLKISGGHLKEGVRFSVKR